MSTVKKHNGLHNDGPATEAPAAPKPKSHRLISLDAFRGLTIVGMLLVNDAAMDTATPKHLMHAPWNQGITFADMVFPWFLFIAGIAIPFSKASQRKKGMSSASGIWKALNRCIILVLLGCLLDSSMVKRPIFDLGVLQLIGLAYLLGTILYELPGWLRYSVAGLLLLGHWWLLKFVEYPGGHAGILLENQNIVDYINRTYLRTWGLWGVLSVIPTTALVIVGTGIGDLFRRDGMSGSKKTLWVIFTGVLLSMIGWFWSQNLPFNKPLWTASYIIEAAGLGCLVLAVFYWIVDVKGISIIVFPLVVFGMNAIAAYLAPILTKILILQEWTVRMSDGNRVSLIDAALKACVHSYGRINGGWVYTGGYIAVWWLVMLHLYRKKIFFKV